MNAEEFIDQYGRIEMMKMMKKDKDKSEMNMKLGNEIKNMMKKQLENITPYQSQQTMSDGTMQGKLRQSYNPMNKSYKPKESGAPRQSVGN